MTTSEIVPQHGRQQARRAGQLSADTDYARVATYRQPAPSPYTCVEAPSPNYGSQAPFHQRYSHYKHYGFAGEAERAELCC